MKKTSSFVLCSFLAFLLCAVLFHTRASVSLAFEAEQGDRSVLNTIAYQGDIATLSGRVSFEIRNGSITTNLQETKSYMEAKHLAQKAVPTDHTNDPFQLLLYDLNQELTPWEKTQQNVFDHCGEEQQSYASASIGYLLYHEREVSIDTGLSLHANDQLSITRKRCAYQDNEYQDAVTLSSFDHERYFRKEALSVKTDNVSYFMPLQTASVHGKNYIYRIAENLSVQPLVELPEGRAYEELHLANDQLIILAHDDEAFYVMIYDQLGSLLKQISYPYRYHGASMQSFSTTRYLLWQDDTTCWIYDSVSMAMQELPLSDTSLHLQAAAEQQDDLFIAAQQIQDGKHYLHISAYRNGERIYHGKILLLEYRETTEQAVKYPVDIVEWGYFVR